MSNKARPRKKRRSDLRREVVKQARQMPQRDNAERLPNGDWRVTLPARHGVSPTAEGLGTVDGPVGELDGKPHMIVEVEDDCTLILRPWPLTETLKHRAREVKSHLRRAVGAALARPGK